MTAIPQSRVVSPRAVPQRIAGPLLSVARRRSSVQATRGVLLTLLVVLTVVLAALLVLGLFPHVPLWGRVTAAAVVWGSLVVAGVAFLLPAARRRTLVQTAMEVERQLAASGKRDTHERIASAVELQQETDARFAGSPDLVRHLISQAETDAAAIRAEQVVPAKSVGWLALLLLPVLGAWVTLAVILPPTKFLRPLFHLLVPWKETPAFLSDVVVKPGDFTVGQGEPMSVDVVVTPRELADKTKEVSRATLFVQPLGPDGKTFSTAQVEVPLARTGPRSFRFAKPAEKTFRYQAATDVGESAWYTATVEPVPAVEGLTVRYDYPAYTQLPFRMDPASDGAVEAVRGTKVTLTVATAADLAGNGLLSADSRLVVVDRAVEVAGGTDANSLNNAAAGADAATASPTTGPSSAADGRALPLARVADGRYEASFTLDRSGAYTVSLVNGFKRANKDKAAERPIVVRLDEKPTVTITAPSQEIRVRPDETVPVAFQASDDYGLAKVELHAQVDGGAETVVPMPLAEKWPKLATVTQPVELKALLAKAGASDGAKTITYWLRATDNRDPDPQSVDSTRQTMRLDRSAETLANQQERQNAKDFIEAIRVAIRRLEESYPEVQHMAWSDRGRRFTDDDRRWVETHKEKLEKTGNELLKEANDQLAGPFAAMAVSAKRTAESRILGAADGVAKIDLHADQYDLRKADAEQAALNVKTGKKELEDLLKKVEAQARLLEAQRKLEDLAKKQDDVAKAMEQAAAKNQQQPNQPQQQPQQQRINEQTRQAIDQAQLNDRKAEQQAQAMQELLDKVADLQKDQQKAVEQNQKQAELAEAEEAAKTLAEKQAALNAKVAEFAKADQKALEQANARPPEPKVLADIVRDLNAAKVQQAADQQREAARRLEEDARQLEAQAKNPTPAMTAEQRASAEQAKASADRAEQRAEEAKAQARQAADAQKEADKAADRAAEAAKAAERAKAAAAEAEAAKSEAAKAAESAKAEAAKADDAKQDTNAKQEAKAREAKDREAKAQEAKTKEAQAKEAAKAAAQQAAAAAKQAAQVAKAASKAAESVKAKADATQKSATADAKAKDDAKQAGETAKAAQAAAKEAQTAADKAQAAADQAAAAQQAKDAGKQNEATKQAAAMARQAGQKAAEAADKAAEAAQQIAEVQKQGVQQAKAENSQAARDGARAAADKARALAQEQKGIADEAAAQAQAMAKLQQQGAQPAAQAAAQQAELGKQAQKAAARAQALGQLADQNANPAIAQRAQAAKEALEQAAAAQQQAADAQKAGSNEAAAGAQEAAQNNLARAEQALRGQQPAAQQPAGMAQTQQKPKGQNAQAKAGDQPAAEQAAGEGATGEAAAGEQPADGAGKPQAAQGDKGDGQKGEGQQGEQAKADGQGEPKGEGEAGKGEEGQQGKGQGKGGQPQQAAMAEPHPGEAGTAEAGQAGTDGQAGQQPATPQQAMKQAQQAAAEATAAQQQAAQGNQAAAQQAAKALAQAAKALAQATGQGQPGQGQAQANADQPGQEPGEGQDQPQPSPTAGQSGDPKNGIAATANGSTGSAPPAVAELGITPSDWAKLPPQQQKDLMNAAQQSGPPEYQAMIKNYYVRIARMQARNGQP